MKISSCSHSRTHRTSICLVCWRAALCARVRIIRRIQISSGCAYVFEKYDEFGARAAALCTHVRGILRIRSSNGRTLHTCSRNTTNSKLERLHFAHVFEKYNEFGDPAAAVRLHFAHVPRTSICLACWLAAFCTHVREIQRILNFSD